MLSQRKEEVCVRKKRISLGIIAATRHIMLDILSRSEMDMPQLNGLG